MAIQTIARLQNRRGLYADLPTSLAEGEFGWCLDTRQLFIGNSNGYGANTEVLTAYSHNDELITTIYSANGINLSSAISRTLHAKLDDIASIKDFGAIGDGVTDDAPAINAAISELLKGYPASNNTAVSIFFPAGTYLINSTLLLYPYLSIIGDGNNGTTILAAPGTSMQYMLETVDSLGQTGANIGLNGAVLPTKVHIRDISINTNSQQISAVHSTRYTHIRYERVNVRGGWVSGNPAGTDSAFTCSSIGNAIFTHDLQLVDCDIQGFTNAVLMNDPVAYTTLSRCTLHQLYRGIVAGLTPAYNGPEYTTITQTKFYSISNYGIYVGDASSNPGVTSIGNTFKSVGTPTSVKSIYWGTASVLNGSMGDVFSTAPGVIDNGATNIIVDAQQTNLTGVSGTSGYSGYSGVFNSSSNASSATVIATGSTVARTLANRFADVVNVKDYGAIGDGVTDDTAAFVAAAATGSLVYAPQAIYLVTSSALSYGTQLYGPGKFSYGGGLIPIGNVSASCTLHVPAQFSDINVALNYLNDRVINNGAVVTIQVADGTYTYGSPGSPVHIEITHPQGAQIQIIGNTTTPANVVLQFYQANYSPAFLIKNDKSLGLLDGFTINALDGWTGTYTWNAGINPYGFGIWAYAGGNIVVGVNIYINKFYYGMRAELGGHIYCQNNGSTGPYVAYAGDVGFHAFNGGSLEARYAHASYCGDSSQNLGYGFLAEMGSIVANNGFSIYNYIAGFAAETNGSMWAINTNGSYNLQYGYWALNGGSVDATSSTGSYNGTTTATANYASTNKGYLNCYLAESDHSTGSGYLSKGSAVLNANGAISNYNTTYSYNSVQLSLVIGTVGLHTGNGTDTPTADATSLVNVT